MKIQILNWSQHFENNKSRERDKCSFVCVPNKLGLGLSAMLAEPDGAALYGVFCLTLGLLSRQNKPRDGHLTDTGRAQGRHLTGTELALLWRRPISEIERCFEFICQDNMGWAIDLDQKCPSSARVVPAECPPSAPEGRKEENGREGREPPTPNEGEFELPPPPDWIEEEPQLQPSASRRAMSNRQGLPLPPPSLSSPAFIETWNSWMRYKSQKNKPVTPETAAALFEHFQQVGEARAVAAMKNSIRMAYEGPIEPNGNGAGESKRDRERREKKENECHEPVKKFKVFKPKGSP